MSSNADFVHLHLHTEYSLLDAACKLEKLMAKAAAEKFPALALTDHGNMFGAIEFYSAAKKAGVKPIIGCEVYVAPGSRLEKKPGSGTRDLYHHLVLLAKNEAGYKNLVRLVTAANLEGYYYKPRIDKEILGQNATGLIALSGCLASELSEHTLKGDDAKARATIDWFKQVFGAENYYLELQNHGIPEQARLNRSLLPWAKEFGLKCVASNDVHYVERAHWKAHDCLICVGTQSMLADAKRMRYQPEQFYLRSALEMKALFHEVPEAVLNTVQVAEQCDLTIKYGKGAEHYPVFQPPEAWTREGYLRQLVCEGLEKRYALKAHVEGSQIVIDAVVDPGRLRFLFPSGPDGTAPTTAPESPIAADDPRVQVAVKMLLDRVELELQVIEKTGYVSYFLIVGDFVRHGRNIGISCVARGSAAGSMVTYLLEIANVDPIRYGLLFERFLNPERISPPDIDIDFADDRRQEVIEYVRKKYGHDAVAQIITYQTMGAKSVLRDVGRVMGLGFSECDRLAKMVSDLRWSLKDALAKNPEFKTAYETEEVTRELVDYALILEDQVRGAGVHAAGVVIGAQPLVNLLPLKKDDEGGLVTQYAMGPVGDLGLLKMDFLGLKTLTVLRNTVELVQRTQGVVLDLEALPLDDAKTYALLNNAQTLGVFQLESGGMRDLCKKFQLTSVEHITALVALYRPGPMDLIPDFIERRHGRAPVEYPHPLLEPIARETYGVLIYQEQVMQAAQILAGYTLGAADLLRRAMGKKKLEEMVEQRETFVSGCAAQHQISAVDANRIFDLLEKFAGYGFNKSHAAAYAIVAYQTAYLKANYPVEFLCAMMTNDQGDLAKLGQYITEAKGFGISVLGPDVNESFVMFSPAATAPSKPSTSTGRPIRFGLAAIKGVGELAVEQLLSARQAGGRFLDLGDLCERVDSRALGRKGLEALIKAGACDSLGFNRATLWAQLDACLGRASALAADKARGQASFFDAFETPPPKDGQAVTAEAAKAISLPEWPVAEKLAHEKELLGMYVSGHPLGPFTKLLERYTVSTIEALATLPNRSQTRIGGLVAAVQQGVSKKSGKPYAMVTLEDLTGSVQILAMNDSYDKGRELFVVGQALLVTGEVNSGEDKPKIFPTEILRLEDAPKKFTKQVYLRLSAAETDRTKLEQLRTLTEAHAGRVPVYLQMTLPGGEQAFIEPSERYHVTPSVEFEAAVTELCGADSFHVRGDRNLADKPARKWERRSPAGAGPEE